MAYDIGTKRVAKVMKICRKYLSHVQKSVFEGMITEGQLHKMQDEIRRKIHISEDRVCIYEMDSLKYARKELLGAVDLPSNII